MRRSLVSVCLSLSILVLFVCVGLWLLRRGGEPVMDERPSGAGGLPPGGSSPRGGLAAGTGESEPSEDSSALEPSPPAADPSLGTVELPVSIEGRVTDASGNGVANARVAAVERKAVAEAIDKDVQRLDREPIQALRAFQSSLGDIAKSLPSCVTAADGTYALRGLPGGDHRVVVTHPDFLVHGGGDWILVEHGKRARHDVELVAGQSISGLVRNTQGLPVAGARVRAAPVETARLKGIGKLVQVFIDQTEGASLLESSPVETDSLGAFRLTSLEPGTYDLRLVKEGYAWGEARGVLSGTQGISIALEPAIRITGRVVSPSGNPVAGAEIVLREPQRDFQGPAGPMAVAFVDIDLFGEKDRRASSGEDGRFALEAFSSGSYDFVVRAEGFPEHSRSVALEGAPLDLGDIPLEEGAEISGTVLSPDGRPVEGADIWVPRPSGRKEDRDSRRLSVLEAGPTWSIVRSQTDERGAFRFAGLGRDAHEVAVLAEGYPGDLLDKVAAGARGVTITLKRGLTIRGRVADAEGGDPISGARVGVDWAPVREQTTGEDGSFELRGVGLAGGGDSGGSVVVRASREGYRDARQTVAFPDPASAPVAEADFQLRRLGTEELERGISGVVRDVRGEPIAGALVWAEVPGWPQAFLRMGILGSKAREVRTGGDGTFALPAPHVGGGMRFEVLASHPGLATSRAGPFAWDGGEGKWPFVEIQLGEGASVEGRVTSLDGAPVSGARVRIWRDQQVPDEATLFTQLLPQAVGEASYSAKDGTYRLRRIEPGSYRLEARAQGFATKTIGPVEIGPARVASAGEEPPAGEATPDGGTATRVDIVLDPGGTLRGRVVDLEGDPLPGIEVVAFPIVESSGPSSDQSPPEEEDEVVETGAIGVAAAVTEADGSYEIDHLPGGEFRLLARARGFEPASISSASPGQPLPDLVLSAHARISGRVLDAETGAPLASFSVRLDRKDAGGAFREDHRKARDIDDADGRFACEGLRAGEWRIRVVSKGHLPWQRTVSLAPGGDMEIDVALSTGGRISGIALLPDGSPIAGVTVTARLEAQGREVERRDPEPTRSGQGGVFELAGLDNGAYQVQAAHPDYYSEGAEGVARVDVPSEPASSMRFVLRPAGKILGRIRGLTFKSPGWSIWVVVFSQVAADPAEAGARGGGRADGKDGAPRPGPGFQVWTDENGTFQRDSVPPGKYKLELVHRRRAPETGNEWITVPPESRPLGEVEIRAGEMTTFQCEAP